MMMIGEKINGTRNQVGAAIRERDTALIESLALEQVEAGATYLDVNAGARPASEAADLGWLIDVVQQHVSVPLCLDSADPDVLEAGYQRVEQPPLINSISLEPKRYEPLLGMLRGKDCGVVALCMDGAGLPGTAAEIVQHAERLVSGLESVGIDRSRIYVDPLARPVSTDTGHVLLATEAVAAIRAGSKHLIIPRDNEKDYLELAEVIRKQLTVHLVESMDEVLDLALVGGNRKPARPRRKAATGAGLPAQAKRK